jgi:hypothetical protein
LGIGVAIPAVWLFNFLTQRISRLLSEMECVAEELAVIALCDPQPVIPMSLNVEREGKEDGRTTWHQ